MFTDRKFTLVWIAIVFGLVVVLNALATWHQATRPWIYIHSDQENLAAMFYARIIPDHFVRDHFFSDDRYFAYYTPSYLSLVGLATEIAGDFFHGAALLQGPILAAYLVAAYLLFWQITDSRAIALTFALLSIVGSRVINELWRVTGFYIMLPRTNSLPGIMTASFLLLRFLGSNSAKSLNGTVWWHWLLLGLLVGANANLHPPTGITFSLVIGLVILASWKRNRRPSLVNLAPLMIGVVIASAPIVVNVAGGSTGTSTATSADFDAYVTTFEARTFMLPKASDRLAYFSFEQQYLIGYLWLPLTLIPWLLAKPNQRSWASLLFVFFQLFYIWLLVRNIDTLVDGLIIAVVAIFFLWRWWKKDEGRELIYYEILAAVIGVSFFLVFFLRTIWLTFEVWQLTTLVAELARGLRLLTLPIYLIGARFVLQISHEVSQSDVRWLVLLAVLSLLVPLSLWHIALLLLLFLHNQLRLWRQTKLEYTAVYVAIITAISIYMVFQIVTRQDPTLVALLLGAGVGLSFYILSLLHVREVTVRLFILIGVSILVVVLTLLNVISPTNFLNDSPWYVYVLRGTPEFITFLLGSVIGVGLWFIFKPYAGKPGSESFVWLCASFILLIVLQAPGFIRYSLKPNTQELPAIVQAGLWAQENAPLDALFFDTFDDGSRFRVWSLRSVTHGWKELGLVGYAQPLDMARSWERYQQIIAHSESTGDTLAMADELGADYIIRDKDLPLDLPVVYENNELVIYQLTL